MVSGGGSNARMPNDPVHTPSPIVDVLGACEAELCDGFEGEALQTRPNGPNGSSDDDA